MDSKKVLRDGDGDKILYRKPTKKKSGKKPKAKRRRLSKGATPKPSGPQAPMKVGDRVQGQWRGDDEYDGMWYYGKVKSVNVRMKTIHINYDDGTKDKRLPWEKVKIL